MNTKEKILFIASEDYLSKLKENDLDFENHNRLFWCHLAAISFLTSGISDFSLDLTYKFVYASTNSTPEELGTDIELKGVSFITTNNALIEFSNRCTRNSLKLNNPIFGSLRCFDFKNAFEIYIHSHIKIKKMSDEEHKNYGFNSLFLKFRIHNRKSEETQNNFLKLLHEQCPEIEYFVNYLKTKDKLVPKNLTSNKKFKI